jgi:hypothetical protein
MYWLWCESAAVLSIWTRYPRAVVVVQLYSRTGPAVPVVSIWRMFPRAVAVVQLPGSAKTTLAHRIAAFVSAESPRCIVLIVFQEEVSHHKNKTIYSKWVVHEICCVGYYV